MGVVRGSNALISSYATGLGCKVFQGNVFGHRTAEPRAEIYGQCFYSIHGHRHEVGSGVSISVFCVFFMFVECDGRACLSVVSGLASSVDFFPARRGLMNIFLSPMWCSHASWSPRDVSKWCAGVCYKLGFYVGGIISFRPLTSRYASGMHF